MPRTRTAIDCCPPASRRTKAQKKKWSDLDTRQRTAIVIGAVVQLTLLTLAQRDLARRPADQIRGGKTLWRILTLVNFIGPISYFLFGRKRPAPGESDATTVADATAA